MRTTSFKSRAFALVSTTALLATLVVASPANAAATGPTCDGKTPIQTCTGTTSDGAAYKMVIPATFNGTVTIWSHGFGGNTTIPGYFAVDSTAQLAPNGPGENGGSPVAIKHLTDKGVALIGSGFSTQAWNLDEAVKISKDIGFPVMIKATNGGGGRGIRRCDNENEVESNYERVISEATKAFGSPEVFIEKCVLNPKHIEVQILADQDNNAIHLFERDCSIQRRNQKLIEIAPSPQLNEEQRTYIGDLAVKASKAVNYQNAGTVEFLLDSENNFYFMEMNTRLQVEHTITENITGVDIVQEQIRIASGLSLRYKQEEIQHRGYSIEFRINAEDPKQEFVPSFGKITRYYAAGGPGVRTDASIYTGYIIPPYYDSMCAKLIIWALNWDDAVTRGIRALGDIGVFGVKTTIPYYVEILKNEKFIGADFNTSFVESNPELTDYNEELPPTVIAAAIGAAIAAHEGI